VADFAVIARQWQAQGRSHHGLVFTSDHRLPRSRHTIGRYVELLAVLMSDSPAVDSFVDRVHWLSHASAI
jgi:L-arabinose isomerase